MDICETEGVIMKIKDYYKLSSTAAVVLQKYSETWSDWIDWEYGEMIAFDNVACPIEWYYLNGMGLTAAPAGRWLCPDCEDSNRYAFVEYEMKIWLINSTCESNNSFS